jgi:hypothetical protein
MGREANSMWLLDVLNCREGRKGLGQVKRFDESLGLG